MRMDLQPTKTMIRALPSRYLVYLHRVSGAILTATVTMSVQEIWAVAMTVVTTRAGAVRDSYTDNNTFCIVINNLSMKFSELQSGLACERLG